jgi:hypothetical protein
MTEINNNNCHHVILRTAGFAITLYYHPADAGGWLLAG